MSLYITVNEATKISNRFDEIYKNGLRVLIVGAGINRLTTVIALRQ